MSREKESHFSASDFFLMTALVLLGIAVTLWIYLPSKEEGTQLEVRQNGTVIMTLPLDEDTEQTITDDAGNKNTFHIKNKTVTMTEANCHDSTCLRTGGISHAGESIVCLPHRLVLQIIKEDKDSGQVPDAIVH